MPILLFSLHFFGLIFCFWYYKILIGNIHWIFLCPPKVGHNLYRELNDVSLFTPQALNIINNPKDAQPIKNHQQVSFCRGKNPCKDINVLGTISQSTLAVLLILDKQLLAAWSILALMT
jgi:hypothetical protein